jgi:hypothetical protein
VSCAVAARAYGPVVNPWPPDPERTAEARRLAQGMTDEQWAALVAPFRQED